ncbi:MAG: electron transporter SenC [Flaviaesturariibacter sp.]|nr:electron transporter SenC [Flaviaesturariibacter sp.]
MVFLCPDHQEGQAIGKEPTVNKTALLGLLVALLLPLTGYLIVNSFSDQVVPMPRHMIYDSVSTRTVNGKEQNDTTWHRIPDFSLTNQLGRQVGWNDMKGKVVVADFFFTHCPTICPRLTTNMKRLQDGISSGQKIGDQQQRFVQFLSFTVDPERDSVEALREWGNRFSIDPDNWWLLTGDKKAIYDLSIKDMKVLAIDGKGVDTNFFHTDVMVLIDKNRLIRGFYHGLDTASVGQLSRDIILVSLEKDPKRAGLFAGQLGLLAVVFGAAIVCVIALFVFLKKEKPSYGPRTDQE